MMRRLLVVGCGFAGAVFARELAEAGWDVQMIDRRDHIAGNAYDETDENGVRIHRYGPHLFHTSNKTVVDWVQRFGELGAYEHKVEAMLPDGRRVPLPINRHTINAVFNVDLQPGPDVEAFLQTKREPIEDPRNAGEYLRANIGTVLTDLFFRPYTKKMWQFDLEDMDSAVVRRIPLRFDDEDRYFPNDTYQYLPVHGYTRIFEAILDHPRIGVSLGTEFRHDMLENYYYCFNSMPIDEFFEGCFGPLPYRSIRFHHRAVPRSQAMGTAATVNFTDDGVFTRETDWSRLPYHAGSGDLRTVTREEPCDYRDNSFERYYPIKTSDGRYEKIYDMYKEKADSLGTVTFIGRCGTYQYLDMHQVINQSLVRVADWIKQHGSAPNGNPVGS